jgi:hypothetical protein
MPLTDITQNVSDSGIPRLVISLVFYEREFLARSVHTSEFYFFKSFIFFISGATNVKPDCKNRKLIPIRLASGFVQV